MIALDFPIPERIDFTGLRLPYGVMLDLAGILDHVDIKDVNTRASGIYFKGMHSLLLPTGYVKDAKTVHWHLIWHEDSAIALGLIYNNKEAKN